jgi:16S rRNA (guanine527-N7)-methyltransferase
MNSSDPTPDADATDADVPAAEMSDASKPNNTVPHAAIPNDTLAAALARHAIELPPAQVAALDQYCKLLWDWNTKINLTRHDDYEKFVTRDLVDSMAFAEFLEQGESILDVGSGGGVPGVILAVIRPDLKVSLAESVGKKARVLSDIVGELHLPIVVFAERAENILQLERFDALVVRAVARLRKLLEWFRPHWASFGRLLVLKGPAWVDERGEARHYGLMHELELRKLKSYPLPDTESESVLLRFTPKENA